MVHHSVKYVPWKDYKPVTAARKIIYQSATEDEALLALDHLSERRDDKYPQISKSRHWHNLNTLFSYPEDIRKAIDTTHAIKSLNSVIRKAVKKQKRFPTDDSAMRVIDLALREASIKGTMPIHHWKLALNRLMTESKNWVRHELTLSFRRPAPGFRCGSSLR